MQLVANHLSRTARASTLDDLQELVKPADFTQESRLNDVAGF
jgi:hypothetical protein